MMMMMQLAATLTPAQLNRSDSSNVSHREMQLSQILLSTNISSLHCLLFFFTSFLSSSSSPLPPLPFHPHLLHLYSFSLYFSSLLSPCRYFPFTQHPRSNAHLMAIHDTHLAFVQLCDTLVCSFCMCITA